MYIPVWLLVILIIVFACTVLTNKQYKSLAASNEKFNAESEQRLIKRFDEFTEHGLYRMAYKAAVAENFHAIEIMVNLRDRRDQLSLDRAEMYLDDFRSFENNIEDLIQYVKDQTGLEFVSNNSGAKATYEDWLAKVNEQRALIQQYYYEVKAELKYKSEQE